MTPGEISLFVGLLINAAVCLYTARLATKANHKLQVIHEQTNGMREQLEQAARAEGKLEGALEEKSRNQ